MDHAELLQSARILLDSNRGRPNAASVRRAISSIYYALFHCLAKDCADLLIGRSKAARSQSVWEQAYRALDHGQAKERCGDKTMLARSPAAIRDFAELFATLQGRRHDADYDPGRTFFKSEAEKDLLLADIAIAAFTSSPTADRRAFCAFVLLKKRR